MQTKKLLKRSIMVIILLLSCNATERTITVSGTGTVTFIPDMATLSITIENVNSTLNESLFETKKTVENINTVCDTYKIDKKDIKTSYINTDKQYSGDYNSRKFIGYSATESMQITFRQLEKMEQFTADLLALRITSINSIQFNHSKFSEFSSEADLLALDDARKAAHKVADRMEVKLGKVKYVNTASSDISPIGPANYESLAYNKSLRVGFVAAPGILSVSNTVSIIYFIE